jgi:hypothetical protein
VADSRADLVREYLDLGFHSLEVEPGRAERHLQQAVDELLVEHPWEWRRREATLAMPATIPDLGVIEQVMASSHYPLHPTDLPRLRDSYGQNVGSGGVAQYYWRQSRQIGLHPGEATATVYYFTIWGWTDSTGVTHKEEATLASDVPLCPREFRDILILGCAVRGHRDLNDSEEAQTARSEWEMRVEQMKSDDNREQIDELREVVIADEGDWA